MRRVNNLFKKKKSKIILFILADILVIFITAILALWLRFDFLDVPAEYMDNVFKCLLPDILIMLLIFTLFNSIRIHIKKHTYHFYSTSKT